jgi:hypothetical protein
VLLSLIRFPNVDKMEGPLIAKYSQVESALAVRVKLPKELVHSVKGKQKSVFIALDKSGSMYSSFDSAKVCSCL